MRCPVCAGEAQPHLRKDAWEILRCRQCGLGFVHPLPSREQLAALYRADYYAGSQALGYLESYAVLEPGLKRTYRGLLERMERRRPTPPRRVLDVGCAYGYFLDVARDRYAPEACIGVDPNPAAIEALRARGHDARLGGIEDVALPPASFDLVFLGDAFEHFADPVAVAERLAQLVAPGGAILLTTVAFDSWAARLLGARWRLVTPPEHLFYWTRDSLARLFRGQGLAPTLFGYTLYYPARYVGEAFRRQFGVPLPGARRMGARLLPIPSYDVVAGLFERPAGEGATGVSEEGFGGGDALRRGSSR